MLYQPIQIATSCDTPFNPGARGGPERFAAEPWRGPHSGREFHLLKQQRKPLAILWLDDLMPLRRYLGPVARQFDLLSVGDAGYLVCARRQLARVTMYERTQRMYADGLISRGTYSARLGLLLGYTHADVARFLAEFSDDFRFFAHHTRPRPPRRIERWTHLRLEDIMRDGRRRGR